MVSHSDINDDGLIIKEVSDIEKNQERSGVSLLSRDNWKVMFYLTFKCAFALFAIMISFFSNSLVAALLTSRIFLESGAVLLKQIFNPAATQNSNIK